jgi:hypothetical protein
MFSPGQKVVCVDASPGGWPHALVEGEIYTVAAYSPVGTRCVADNGGVLTLELTDAVWLLEPVTAPGNAFRASRFRPRPLAEVIQKTENALEPA